MLFALILAHGGSAFTIGETGGLEEELAMLFMLSGITLFFTGGGRYVLLRPKNIVPQRKFLVSSLRKINDQVTRMTYERRLSR